MRGFGVVLARFTLGVISVSTASACGTAGTSFPLPFLSTGGRGTAFDAAAADPEIGGARFRMGDVVDTVFRTGDDDGESRRAGREGRDEDIPPRTMGGLVLLEVEGLTGRITPDALNDPAACGAPSVAMAVSSSHSTSPPPPRLALAMDDM